VAATRVDFDPCYMTLGETPVARAERYATWVSSAIPSREWEEIRQAVQRGHLTGNGKFVERVATKIGRRVECRKPGRPKGK